MKILYLRRTSYASTVYLIIVSIYHIHVKGFIYFTFNNLDTNEELGLTHFVTILLAMFVPPALSSFMTASIVLGIDPLNMVTCDICTQMEIPIGNHSLCMCISYQIIRVLVMIPVFELGRTVTNLLWITLVALDLATGFLKTVLKKVKNGRIGIEDGRRTYTQAAILYHVARIVCENGLAIFFSASFWFLLLGTYIMITGFSIVPVYIYVIVSSMFSPTFASAFVTLAVVSEINERSKLIVGSLKERAWRGCRTAVLANHKRNAIVAYKACHSMQPEMLVYVPTKTPVDREFMKDWFKNCFDRLIDTVVIF